MSLSDGSPMDITGPPPGISDPGLVFGDGVIFKRVVDRAWSLLEIRN